MMAAVDKIGKTYREANCHHDFSGYEREIGVVCSRCGMRKPDPQ